MFFYSDFLIYLKPEPNHNIYNVVLIIYCTFNLFLTVRHGVFFFFIFVQIDLVSLSNLVKHHMPGGCILWILQ